MWNDRTKKEEFDSMEFDELDRTIIQALSEELSEIEVSEELIARTLCAAGKNTKKAISHYFFGGTIAAAVLLFIILGFRGTQGGQDKADNEFLVQDHLSGALYEPDSISDGMQENEIMDWAGEKSPVDAPKEEDIGEWLYQELLAVLNEEEPAFSSDEKVEGESGKREDLLLPEKNQEEESRRIVWQREGRILTCVVYLPDYRIEALLQEGERTRQVSIKDFAYAKELWEFALD